MQRSNRGGSLSYGESDGSRVLAGLARRRRVRLPEADANHQGGVITTPNYPEFLLAHLDCTLTILAPADKRIWLEFSDPVNTQNEDVTVELKLGKQSPIFRPFETEGLLTEGSFVSTDERLRFILRTGDNPKGVGFRAAYKVITATREEKIITLSNYTSGMLLHLNYPDNPPTNVDFLQHFVAPLGCVISLELYHVRLSDTECSDGRGTIEVFDNYSDANGTSWKLCYDADVEAIVPVTPIYISSFLNTLHVRQRSESAGIPLNGSLRVQYDENIERS
ncbi:hypothetical protein NQ318_015524 [Aromia moschata]|uniref:CUB domain-containing protein n=1 Tax=Aromia moschata TaxID=1265417 RepID=A0AAV8XR00_9CUCU|nr:hypothetical protein NQ318_015524 [Aromia moschata]